jgi:hypothetical protein
MLKASTGGSPAPAGGRASLVAPVNAPTGAGLTGQLAQADLESLTGAELEAERQRVSDWLAKHGLVELGYFTAEEYLSAIDEVLVGALRLQARQPGPEPQPPEGEQVSRPDEEAMALPTTKATSGDDSRALEIHPPELRFEATKIGQGRYRQVSITNHTLAPVNFGGFFGISSGAPVAASARADKQAEGAPAPVREAPKLLGAHYAFTGPFKLIDDPNQHTVKAGGSIEPWVDFAPTKVGTHTGMFWVLSMDGEAIGWFNIVGEGLERQTKQENGADRSSVGDDHDPPTAAKDPAVNAARQLGLVKLAQWQQAADTAIVINHNKMVSEWSIYLHKTSSNPVLSIASVPNPIFLAMLAEHTVGGNPVLSIASVPHPTFPEMLAEHTVGGFAAKKAEHLIEHMAKHFAAEGVGKAAAGIAGAEVGSIVGPAGALIGFAVGVLIETVCGMLFQWLSGEDAEIEKMLHEQYESGWSEGSQKAGELLDRKIKELDGTEKKALTYQGQQRTQYERLITKSNDAQQLDHLIAEVEAHTDLANEAQPKEGFADELLALWVREFARGPAEAGKDVNEKQWEKVAEELEKKRNSLDPEALDGSLKQPDLFVVQCLHEWTRRGLAPPADLGTKLFVELAQLGIKPNNTSHAEVSGHLQSLAEKAWHRFDRREFVWTNVFDLRGEDFVDEAKRVIKHGEIQPHVPQYENERSIPLIRKDDTGQFIMEGRVDMVDEVLCYPVLATDGSGTCYVERFDYRIKAYGKSIIAYTFPGTGWLSSFDERSADPKDKPQQAASGELYELMSKLGGYGLTVTAEPDADRNPWLQSMFGADVIAQRSQHADARPEPVKVYRLTEIVVIPPARQEGVSELTLPDDLWEQINGRFERAWQGRYLMVRGGNTILVIET